MRIAFALAGLGGFNAHGAGFLAAATKWGVEPELVTATSGQILVLADWLATGHPCAHLSFAEPGVNAAAAQLKIAVSGYPGVFRPAFPEALFRFVSPNVHGDLRDRLADLFLPAQQYVPQRTEADFEGIAATLNGSRIGVVFNTYDPKQGTGFLYGNDAARTILPKQKALPNAHAARLRQSAHRHDLRYVSEHKSERTIHPITVEAVKSALWLSLYGFHGMPAGQIDGAYHRSCIVSELHEFGRIFVVRPLADGWHGREPANWFQVQDWDTEMWFSVGYKAEVAGLLRINDLIDAGAISDGQFRKVDLVEIEPETPAGYFHYFVERKDVYEQAFAIAEEAFESLGLAKPGAGPVAA